MQKGTVKWFNPTKGYGFIRPSTGDKDVFVHISAVERAGLSSLNEGQVVEYELVTNRGKTSAENLIGRLIAVPAVGGTPANCCAEPPAYCRGLFSCAFGRILFGIAVPSGRLGRMGRRR